MEIVAIWFGVGIVCAVLSYGMTFHHFRHKFPMLTSDEDVTNDHKVAAFFAFMTLVMPPMVLMVAFMSAGPHFGLRFR